MLRFLSLIIVIFVSIFHQVSSETCTYGYYTYYCSRKSKDLSLKLSSLSLSSVGQTCGSYYGDCRGLSAYAIMGIVFGGITLLSICIRCCIYMNAPTPAVPRPIAVTTTPTGRVVRVRVQAQGNPGVVRAGNMGAHVHQVVEDAPPSYAIATSPQGKY